MPDGAWRPRRPLRPLPQPDPAERRVLDGWVRVAGGVVLLHAALLLTLWARPGRIALWIWYAGPIGLALVTAGLLAASLRSARRWRHGVNGWQVLGYAGLMTVIFTLPVYDPYPSSYDDRPSRVAFRLPLEGPVTVAWGGPTADVNYHVFLPDQRWAYDLLVTPPAMMGARSGPTGPPSTTTWPTASRCTPPPQGPCSRRATASRRSR